jgi:hypothetical protein
MIAARFLITVFSITAITKSGLGAAFLLFVYADQSMRLIQTLTKLLLPPATGEGWDGGDAKYEDTLASPPCSNLSTSR